VSVPIPDSLPFGEGESRLDLLGHALRVLNRGNPEELARAKTILEQTFRNMERAYELEWHCPPSALDTTTWLLMGALNLAHRVARLEQEACQHTQELEHTLTQLLDDVPDDTSAAASPIGDDVQPVSARGH